MAVTTNFQVPLYPSSLASRVNKRELLERANVDYIPYNDKGQTLRTRPLTEDDNLTWREQYLLAGRILLTNPLCFVATRILAESVASGDLVVKEKQGNTWVQHTTNTLEAWLDEPNPTMDREELVKATITHLSTFGKAQGMMFQKGDLLPNGDICESNNVFDIVYPVRLLKDLEKPNSHRYFYQPMRSGDKVYTVSDANVFVDVFYNPMAHEVGTALPNNPLRQIFSIHNLYLEEIERFFTAGGIPRFILRHVPDVQKDPLGASRITDDDVEETVNNIMAQIGQKGRRPNGIVGLNGNWDIDPFGTPLPELLNKDLTHSIEALIAGTYGIPPSIFWVGLQHSNQRASRQMDNIDFFNRTVSPYQKRIAKRLGKFLIPRFFDSKMGDKFKLEFDTSNMPLAQAVRLSDNRQFERWWQLRVLNREQLYEKLGIPTLGLTDEEKKGYYEATGVGLNVGAGDQSTSEMNGLD